MITFVQSQTNTGHNVSSLTAAFPSANTAGNLIVVCVGAWGGGTSPTVSDSAGNTYSLIQTDSSSGSVVAVWYAKNINVGANTVTIAGLSSADIDVIIAEYAGLSITTPLSASSVAVNAGATPNVTGAAITPAISNSMALLYAYDQSNAGDAFTFTSSPTKTFTPREVTSNTGGESSALSDSIGTFSSALTPTAAISAGSSNALYLVAAFFAEDTGTPPAGQLTMLGAWAVTNTVQTVEASFGTAPLTFTSSTLPPGLSLDGTGALTGAGTTAGTYTFTITVTDSVGKTASLAITASLSTLPVDTSVCAAIIPGYLA